MKTIKRNTLQRQIINEAVEALGIHPTAEQVVEFVSKNHPGIGRATVYRNLNSLAESEEIVRISNFSGTTHYDHNCSKHYHFMCNNCKKIFDVDYSISNICSNFQNNHGFDITDYNLSFNGICWECKAQQESGSAAFLSFSCEAPLPFGSGQENAKRSDQFPDK